MFRTKTSSDNKVCKERKHRTTLLILGVFRVGIKEHSTDNEKSIVKMENQSGVMAFTQTVACFAYLCRYLVLEKIAGTPSWFEFYPFEDQGSRKPKISN